MTGIYTIYHTVLPLLLILLALAVCRCRDLFSAVTLMSMFSLVAVSLFVSLQALDVALTEAVVGAGVSTVLFLCCLARTTGHQLARTASIRHRHGRALLVCFGCGALLCYGTFDMPGFGDAGAFVHNHVNPYYLESTWPDTGIINVVTATLAAYRGYDTLGELVVIFTAGAGSLMLIGRGHDKSRQPGSPP